MPGSVRSSPDTERRSGRPSKPRRTLLWRFVSAGILIPVALGVVSLGGWVLAAFAALVLILLIREWSGLVGQPAYGPEAGVLSLCGLAAIGLMAAGQGEAALGATALGALAAGLLGAGLKRDGFWTLFAGFYLVLPAIAFLWLRASPDGFFWCLWLFAVVWTTDSGAYLAGRVIGGPAFAPQSSPNKTWAGLIGGIVLAMAAGTAAGALLFPPGSEFHMTALKFASWSMLISGVTQAGDIFESGLKRHFGVKDTGRVIPGHGGVLDRLDGFLFAVMMLVMVLGLRQALAS